MTKAQHTPGPWIIGSNGLIMACTNTVMIARVGADNPNFSRAADHAVNAYLIAAAPDMLKVLESIYLGHLTPEQADEVIAVIAKAKGEA